MTGPDGHALASAKPTGAFWIPIIISIGLFCICLPVWPLLLLVYLVRGLWIRPRFAVLDAGGCALASFAPVEWPKRRFVLEVRSPGLEPDLALALGTVLAMDPSGTS